MEKINDKWMHDGNEYEVVEGDCTKCPFVGELGSCKLSPSKCENDLGRGERFKLKENQNMIKPFKCAAMTPDRVANIFQAIKARIPDMLEPSPQCERAQMIYFAPENRHIEYSVDADYFVAQKNYEEITFDQAMQMILAAPVLTPAPKFEFKPFDQILRQNKHSETWKIGFYSHIEPNNFIGLNQATVMRMLPYKGNENLLNTKTKPKGWWEVENGSPVWRIK